MPIRLSAATEVALPAHAGVSGVYQTVHLADAFAIALPPGSSRDPELLARFIFAHQPAWIGKLTKLRDLIVAGFGLKTAGELANLGNSAKAQRVGIFRIYSTSQNEIVVGEDDKHLDFRVSVLCSGEPASGGELTLSTVVHCHNLLGHAYLFVIAPFHRMVVKASLRRAAHVGWPKAGAAHATGKKIP
jgi:hypothetical protein